MSYSAVMNADEELKSLAQVYLTDNRLMVDQFSGHNDYKG